MRMSNKTGFRTIDGPTVLLKTDTEGHITRDAGNRDQYFTARKETAQPGPNIIS